MQFKTKLMSGIVVLCILSFVAGFVVNKGFAAGQTVIGKATITKGTLLNGVLGNPPNITTFNFKAFKDQTLYIIKKVEPVPDKHPGGYVLDGSGFFHDCSFHGEEIVGTEEGSIVMISLPMGLVTDGTVKIELF